MKKILFSLICASMIITSTAVFAGTSSSSGYDFKEVDSGANGGKSANEAAVEGAKALGNTIGAPNPENFD